MKRILFALCLVASFPGTALAAFENVVIHSLKNGVSPVDGYREDLVASDVVTLSLAPLTGISGVKWQLVGRPEGSVAGGVGPEPVTLSTSLTSSFTVDTDAGFPKDGTYVVHAIINPGAPSQKTVSTILCRRSGLATVDGRLLRKIGGFEALEDTSIATILQGYATQLNRWLEYVRGLGAGSGAPTTPTYLTRTDATGALPNSYHLSGHGVGFLKTDNAGTATIDTTVYPTSAYSTIKVAGVAVPQHSILNLVSGARVTAVDNGTATDVDLATTGVTAGACTSCNLTIDAYGRVLIKANGSGGGSGITQLTGDVLAGPGSGSVASTLAANAVTYPKFQLVGASSFLGNSTGAPATVAELSPGTARTLLGLAAVATSASASDITSGTLALARLPTMVANQILYGQFLQSSGLSYDGTSVTVTANGPSLFTALKLVDTDAAQFDQAAIDTYTSSGAVIGSRIATGPDFRITTYNTSSGAFQIRGSTNSGAGSIAFFVDTNNGDIILGPGSLTTGATKGFAHMSASAGVPTGVPVRNNGTTDGTNLSVDKTNHRLYGYFPDNIWHYASFDDGAAGGGAITALTGDGTATGPGSVAFTLAASGVGAGSCTSCNLTIDAKGRVTAQASGGGGGGITQLTGDVVAGPGSGSQVATISASSVTLADMANIATASFIGRVTAGTGVPQVLTAANAWTILGVEPAANFPALTGAVTTSAGSLATTLAANAVGTSNIAANAVTLAKLATQADQTVLGNVSGGAAVPSALTKTQTLTFLGLTNAITALTGDVSATGPGSVAATVNSAATGFTIGTAATGVKPSLRNPDNAAGYAQLENYPASGVNTNMYVDIVPRGTATGRLQIFNTDFVASGANFEYLVVSSNSTLFNIFSSTGGAGTLRPLNLQVTAGGTAASNVGLTIDTSNVVKTGNHLPFATASSDLGSSGSVWLNTWSGAVHTTFISGYGGSDVLIQNSAATMSVDVGNANIGTTGDVVPTADNTYAIGSAADRWANVYATTVSLGPATGMVLTSTGFAAGSTGQFTFTGTTSAVDFDINMIGVHYVKVSTNGQYMNLLGAVGGASNIFLFCDGASATFSGGQGTLVIGNRTAAPTNVAGAVVLYSEGGSLKARTATATYTLAP